MSNEKYQKMADKARKLIKEKYDYDIEAELLLCTKDNAPKLVKDLYDRIAPERWEEENGTKEFYDTTFAMAVVGPTANAVVFRTDSDYDDNELQHIMIHEYAHIFANRNEYGGELIDFDKHPGNSEFISGYSIWREFIANYLARNLDSNYLPLDRDAVRTSVTNRLSIITNSTEPEERRDACSDMLNDIMHSDDFITAHTWDEFRDYCCEYLPMDLLEDLLEIVYVQVRNHKKPCWEITEEFIEELGNHYTLLGSLLKTRRIQAVLEAKKKRNI